MIKTQIRSIFVACEQEAMHFVFVTVPYIVVSLGWLEREQRLQMH